MARTTRSRKTPAEEPTAAPVPFEETAAPSEPSPLAHASAAPEPVIEAPPAAELWSEAPETVTPGPVTAEVVTPEPVTEAAPPTPPLASTGRGVTLLVGLVSGALGVAVTLFALPYGLSRTEPPGLDPSIVQRLAALEARAPGLDAAALTPMDSRLSALESAPDLTARLTAIESAPAPAPVDLAPLEARLSALESLPRGADVQALTAMDSRLAALESGVEARANAAVEAALAASLAETQAVARQQQADLEARQQRIAQRAALGELVAAADSGARVPESLAALRDAPAALAPLAEGLITQAALREAFAPAARAAIAAQPLPEDASLTDRLTGFLRAQTGARSLAPRDGDDTDAILSRAEAALAGADLPDALAELATLTGDPAAAMAEWIVLAQTRAAALSALAALQTEFED